MRLLVAACLLAGCDRVFGTQFEQPDAASEVDLDEDGIRDFEDDCIQVPEDLLGDEDGAAPINGEDACPLDWVHTEDPDNDGLFLQCDPLPMVDGERRCFMGFGSGALNAKLWRAREGGGWSPGSGELLFQSGSDIPLTTLASQDLRPAGTTTLDILTTIDAANNLTEVVLWVAANDPPLSDVPGEAGCVVEIDASSYVVRVRGQGPANAKVVAPLAAPVRLRLRATYVPGAAQSTLVCEAMVIDVTSWVRTEAPITFPPVGRIGFGGRSSAFRVQALDMIEHP